MCRTTTSAGLLACGAMLTGCTVETTPGHGETEEPETEEMGGVLQTFGVQLPSDTTEENVIPRVVAAGREEIAEACERTSSVSVRVFNPLALGVYADIPCSTILDDAGEVGGVRMNHQNDGRVGETQQKLTPLGVGCAAFIGAAGLVAQFGVCPRARTGRDKRRCDYWTGGGFFGLTVACAFL
ncbi:hypothetical protein WMF30_45060 [Sorangium sp. So ce134]